MSDGNTPTFCGRRKLTAGDASWLHKVLVTQNMKENHGFLECFELVSYLLYENVHIENDENEAAAPIAVPQHTSWTEPMTASVLVLYILHTPDQPPSVSRCIVDPRGLSSSGSSAGATPHKDLLKDDFHRFSQSHVYCGSAEAAGKLKNSRVLEI